MRAVIDQMPSWSEAMKLVAVGLIALSRPPAAIPSACRASTTTSRKSTGADRHQGRHPLSPTSTRRIGGGPRRPSRWPSIRRDPAPRCRGTTRDQHSKGHLHADRRALRQERRDLPGLLGPSQRPSHRPPGHGLPSLRRRVGDQGRQAVEGRRQDAHGVADGHFAI